MSKISRAIERDYLYVAGYSRKVELQRAVAAGVVRAVGLQAEIRRKLSAHRFELGIEPGTRCDAKRYGAGDGIKVRFREIAVCHYLYRTARRSDLELCF